MPRFEWDPEKARTNLIKHDVAFELATRVWNDPHSDIRLNDVIDGEQRWQVTGLVGSVALIVVIYIDRAEDTIRIISARKAAPLERRRYEQQAI